MMSASSLTFLSLSQHSALQASRFRNLWVRVSGACAYFLGFRALRAEFLIHALHQPHAIVSTAQDGS